MINLNLGCGDTIIDGFVNVDIRANKLHNVVSDDIESLSTFENDSVDLIYASHVLEHFGREKVLKVLNCWYNKLKDGGTLRLSVPDLDAIMRLYVDGKCKLQDITGLIYGGKIVRYDEYLKNDINDNLICTHDKWESWGGDLDTHRCGFNESTLTQILSAVGFKDIVKWDWRKTDHKDYDDFSQAYLPHMDKDNGILVSLNLEAIK